MSSLIATVGESRTNSHGLFSRTQSRRERIICRYYMLSESAKYIGSAIFYQKEDIIAIGC